MLQLFNNSVGRLRIIGFLEGISLIVLVFVAVPLKYGAGIPSLASIMGTLHGALFLLFVFNTISVSVTLRWKFAETTWKVLLACIVPFGTFYIDRTILRKVKWTEDPK
jgi:integral membrane protein